MTFPAPAWAALPFTAAFAGVLWLCNRRLWGCLPDDPPRPGRKQHAQVVPLAGLALLPACLAALLCEPSPWLAVAAVLACVCGHVDDCGKERGRDLDWRWKAVVLLAAAGAVAAATLDPLAAPGAFALAVLFAFVLVNATNFLDNTDGVACALSATSLLLATGGDGALGAAAFAALGFLPWNWPRPRLFLGDSGAYLLGVLVAAAVLRGPLPTALPTVAVQCADFLQVLVARLVLGVPPWRGDRRHLTHVAQNLGAPRWLVAPLFALAALLAANVRLA